MCGEKGLPVSVAPRYQGSPPRVRGKVSLSGTKSSSTRITPACAGKSQIQRGVLYTAEDHPRVCGEKTLRIDVFDASVGSPPRVRGKARSAARSLISTGITPACAGKRACRCRSRRDTRDHPRVCGEKSRCPAQSPARRGSPPRVRGKVRSSAVYCTPPRITPACAGKRRCASTSLMHRWDHPRVCGEKSTASACLFTITGSPPRVRGKVLYSPVS